MTKLQRYIVPGAPGQQGGIQRLRLHSAAVGTTPNLFPCGVLDQQMNLSPVLFSPLKFPLEPVSANGKASAQLVQIHFPLDTYPMLCAGNGSVRSDHLTGVIPIIQFTPLKRPSKALQAGPKSRGVLLPGIHQNGHAVQYPVDFKMRIHHSLKGKSSSSVISSKSAGVDVWPACFFSGLSLGIRKLFSRTS